MDSSDHRNEVRLRYPSSDGHRVEIAGSFNGWRPQTLNRDRELVLKLAPGNHEYKFIVDGHWKHSEKLPTKSDERGNLNNIILVEMDASQPAVSSSSVRATESAYVKEPTPHATSTNPISDPVLPSIASVATESPTIEEQVHQQFQATQVSSPRGSDDRHQASIEDEANAAATADARIDEDTTVLLVNERQVPDLDPSVNESYSAQDVQEFGNLLRNQNNLVDVGPIESDDPDINRLGTKDDSVDLTGIIDTPGAAAKLNQVAPGLLAAAEDGRRVDLDAEQENELRRLLTQAPGEPDTARDVADEAHDNVRANIATVAPSMSAQLAKNTSTQPGSAQHPRDLPQTVGDVAAETADFSQIAGLDEEWPLSSNFSKPAEITKVSAADGAKQSSPSPNAKERASVAAEVADEAEAANAVGPVPPKSQSPTASLRREAGVAAEVMDAARAAHLDETPTRTPPRRMGTPAATADEVADASVAARLDRSGAATPEDGNAKLAADIYNRKNAPIKGSSLKQSETASDIPTLVVDKIESPQPSYGEPGSSNQEAIRMRSEDAQPDVTRLNSDANTDPVASKSAHSVPGSFPQSEAIATRQRGEMHGNGGFIARLWNAIVYRYLGGFVGWLAKFVGFSR